MKHRYLPTITFLLLVLLLSACAPQAAAPTATAIPPSATPLPSPTPNLFGRVGVGGYKLHHICGGEGAPVVIVDGGLTESATGRYAKVFKGIMGTTRICLYDRAGLGQSDPAPTPRTSEDMARDLHTLLVNANIPPPYILVGHSIGGFNVRVYAGLYPDEVAGMVLIDSAHPDQSAKFLAVLPPEAPDEPDYLKTLRAEIPFGDPSANSEGMDIDASADQVRASAGLGDKPLVVLTESPTTWLDDKTLPDEINIAFAQAWQDLQVDLLNLSTNSTQVIATTAGHAVHVDEPQLVIDAILKVVAEVREKTP